LGRNRRPNRQEGSDTADEGNWFSFTVLVHAVSCSKNPPGLSSQISRRRDAIAPWC